MTDTITQLVIKTGVGGYFAAGTKYATSIPLEPEQRKFVELIVTKVLDEVANRAFYSGDRAWSDEHDRPWVELEFGFGTLADIKRGRG